MMKPMTKMTAGINRLTNKEDKTMKKTLIALSAMAVALSFTACNEDVITTGNDTPQAKTIIKAYTETSATRTALSGNDTEGYQVVWSEGDKFMVIGGDEPCEFTLSEINTTDKTSATFESTATLEDGDYTVWYATEDEDNDYISWPATQIYEAGKITNSPMAGILTIEGGEAAPIEFKNMGGLLRLKVKGTATVKSITISANEKMAGQFSYDVCVDPVVAAVITGSKKSITLDCGSAGVALTSDGVDFYIAMPANTTGYTGVSIKLTDTEDKVCTKTLNSAYKLVINRSEITDASFTASDFKSAVTYNKGDKVEFDGHDGIVVDIDGTLVVVATMNVGAGSVNGSDCFGTKMTYDKACAAWSGWRLPTVKELTAFCDPGYPGVCGDTYGVEGGTGAVMWDIDGVGGIDLYLPLNDNDEDGNPSDIYWTGTPGGDGTYYYYAPAIEFDGDYPPLEPRYIRKGEAAKDSEFLVRLFHKLP